MKIRANIIVVQYVYTTLHVEVDASCDLDAFEKLEAGEFVEKGKSEPNFDDDMETASYELLHRNQHTRPRIRRDKKSSHVEFTDKDEEYAEPNRFGGLYSDVDDLSKPYEGGDA